MKPDAMPTDTGRKPARFVYVVTYAYHYEGETVEAIYATKKAADNHPWGGDAKHVTKMRVRTKAIQPRA